MYDTTAGEIYFADRFNGPGTKCIPWNGRDISGNLVTGNFEVKAALAFGVTNLPLYDVEHNRNGYKISLVRPAGTPPVIFWDDSQITDGTAIDGKTNYFGCVSAFAGCHRWRDRGSLVEFDLNKQETINTWWYSTIVTTTMLINMPRTHEVQLSFHPVLLINGDTTVCRGDSLNFYVYNNGQHYDASKYSYEWWYNTQNLSADLRHQKRQILEESQVVVIARDRASATCLSRDTLTIHVVDRVTLTGTVTPPACNTSTGSINVQLLSGPPGKRFYWEEFPGHNSGILSGIPQGEYYLTAMDPAYPHCGADSVFVIKELGGIEIDTVITSKSACDQPTATAEIFMTDPLKAYEYSWNNGPFTSSSTITGLTIGTHQVLARETGTACQDIRTFIVTSTTAGYSVVSSNEFCNNSNGSIQITLPGPVTDYNILWNSVQDQTTVKSNLSAGTYPVRIQSVAHPSCIFDTTAIVENENRVLLIESLMVTGSNCQLSSGTAEIRMASHGSFQYSWNGGPYVSSNTRSNLSVGKYDIRIIENATGCVVDTNFEILALSFPAFVNYTPNICNSKSGTISVISPEINNLDIEWVDGHDSQFFRDSLSSGQYLLEIRKKNYPDCRIKYAVTIKDSSYTLEADFEPVISNPDSAGHMVMKFTNLSKGYRYSDWSFSDGGFSTDFHPTYAFPHNREYEVSLVVRDARGCTGKASKRVSTDIRSEFPCTEINLPNVFSPNHDGLHDDIGILGNAPEVELRIFNRWGEIIFRTFDVGFRWDGTYRGEDAPVGVYPYILDWQCVDSQGKIVRKHKVGDITLVR